MIQPDTVIDFIVKTKNKNLMFLFFCFLFSCFFVFLFLWVMFFVFTGSIGTGTTPFAPSALAHPAIVRTILPYRPSTPPLRIALSPTAASPTGR